MMPELVPWPAASWFPLAAFSIFLLSGMALLFFLHRQMGKRNRELTVRLSGLLKEEGETPPLSPLPERETLYTAETADRGWWARLKSKLIPLLLAMIAGGMALAIALTEFPLATLGVLIGLGAVAAAIVAVQLYRKRVRQRRFVEQLPEAIDIIIRGARVGMTLQENFQVIAREMPEPTGGSFRVLAEKLAIGIDLETALDATVRTARVKELQFMATTLILQRRTGGQYAEVLENLAQVLRDRRTQALKAQALTSEARMSARIVTGVTGVILLIMSITNREQLDFLFIDPLGQNLLIYSSISIIAGFFIISRLLGTLK
ncbi:MAG: type II secretion system F family protein [Sneathiella sp.]